jgi:hypothetical protein
MSHSVTFTITSASRAIEDARGSIKLAHGLLAEVSEQIYSLATPGTATTSAHLFALAGKVDLIEQVITHNIALIDAALAAE